MATLGSTAEPTTGQTWFGLNTTNHHAVLLTMPAGGPWEITRVGAWCSGQSETAQVKVCVWSGGGSLIGQTATFTVASRAFALGNNELIEGALTAPVEVAGGASVFVGIARDPADNVQFGTRSGTRYDKYSSSWPSSLVGSSTVGGAAIGAYISDYHDANSAPNAPVSLSPTGDAVISSGTAPVVSGTRSDPDSGDYITAYQIVVYESDGATVIQDTGKISVTGSPTTFSRTLALNGVNKYVKWKARTWDKKGVAGAYSAQQRFWANAVPSTPPAPSVETDTLSPLISGVFTDSGDSMAAVQIEVELAASPNTDKWLSGDIAKSGASGSAWNQTYAGSALAWGTQYRARYRTKDDQGAYSAWGAWANFTPVQPAGPSNMTPRSTTPRQTSLTPTLTVGHSASFRNEQIEVYPTNSLSGTKLWTKAWDGVDYAAVTSKARVYAGTALTYGQTVYWRSQVELTDGTITAWSPLYAIQINAAPAIPTGLTPINGAVVSTLTPDITAVFSDPDPGDTPLNADLEVQRVSDSVVFWSSLATTALNDGVVTYAGTALAWETQYKWRVRFRDQNGLAGAYSDWRTFKTSQKPTAAGVTPIGGAAVTESTPTLDWTFTSPGGKAQQSFRVRLFDKGPTGANAADEELVLDSGFITSAASQWDVPLGVLLDDHDYRWELTVRDTDGLEYVLS